MKKIIINNTEIGDAIYFDFAEDFNELGCSWILTTAGDSITDCSDDCDSDFIDEIEAIIANYELEDHEIPTERDFDYIRGLIAAWGI